MKRGIEGLADVQDEVGPNSWLALPHPMPCSSHGHPIPCPAHPWMHAFCRSCANVFMCTLSCVRTLHMCVPVFVFVSLPTCMYSCACLHVCVRVCMRAGERLCIACQVNRGKGGAAPAAIEFTVGWCRVHAYVRAYMYV